jgi:hypothetical protein
MKDFIKKAEEVFLDHRSEIPHFDRYVLSVFVVGALLSEQLAELAKKLDAKESQDVVPPNHAAPQKPATWRLSYAELSNARQCILSILSHTAGTDLQTIAAKIEMTTDDAYDILRGMRIARLVVLGDDCQYYLRER